MKTTPVMAIALLTVLLPQVPADDSTVMKAKLGIVYKSLEKVPLRLDLHSVPMHLPRPLGGDEGGYGGGEESRRRPRASRCLPTDCRRVDDEGLPPT